MKEGIEVGMEDAFSMIIVHRNERSRWVRLLQRKFKYFFPSYYLLTSLLIIYLFESCSSGLHFMAYISLMLLSILFFTLDILIYATRPRTSFGGETKSICTKNCFQTDAFTFFFQEFIEILLYWGLYLDACFIRVLAGGNQQWQTSIFIRFLLVIIALFCTLKLFNYLIFHYLNGNLRLDKNQLKLFLIAEMKMNAYMYEWKIGTPHFLALSKMEIGVTLWRFLTLDLIFFISQIIYITLSHNNYCDSHTIPLEIYFSLSINSLLLIYFLVHLFSEILYIKRMKPIITQMTSVSANLENKNIGKRGMRIITHKLTNNSMVQTLILDNCNINDSKLKLIAIAIMKNITLKNLSLNRNLITDRGINYLSKSLEKNVSIRSIYLKGNKVRSEGIKSLSEGLIINHFVCEIKYDEQPTINEVNVAKVQQYLNFNINMFKNIKGSRMDLSPKLLKFLTVFKRKNNINIVNLVQGNMRDDEGIILAELLKAETKITIYNLEDNFIGEIGAEYIANSINENFTLTELNLGSNNIGNEGTMALAREIRVNRTINIVNLSNNAIYEIGAKVFAQALFHNKSLISLDLSNNYIPPSGGRAIAAALLVNQTLINLNLAKNVCNKVAIEQFGASLIQNTTLQYLNLFGNQISDSGAHIMGEMLSYNKVLKELDLGMNLLTNEGAESLAGGIRENKTLLQMGLSENFISSQGANSLGTALIENKQLIRIDLRNNYMITVEDRHKLSHIPRFEHTADRLLFEAFDVNRQFYSFKRKQYEQQLINS